MSHSLKKSWLPLVDAAILQIDQVPLLGNTPPFDWSAFSDHLKRTLQLQEFALTATEWKWREPSKLFEGLGSHLKTLQLETAPLEGTLHWVMSEEDIKNLTSQVLASPIDILPAELQESFYSFIAAEVLQILESQKVTQKIPLRLVKQAKQPSELSLCLDVSFQINQKPVVGRLFLSSLFRKSWKNHLENLERSHFNANIFLNISLCIGHANLSLRELLDLQGGDLVIMHHSKFDKNKLKGSCFLALSHSLLFSGMLENNRIKITENLVKLEELPMSQEPPKKPLSEKEPIQEELSTSDETFSDDTSHDSSEENLTEEGDTSLFLGEDEEFFMEDEELSKVLKEELKEQPKEALPKEKKEEVYAAKDKQSTRIEAAQESRGSVQPEDIPLVVKVEIASLELPAKKVLELHPGNEISLNKEIDNTVRLIVNGKCIAKGELIQIGDVLGVRIIAI